jgi:hypothetical protein
MGRIIDMKKDKGRVVNFIKHNVQKAVEKVKEVLPKKEEKADDKKKHQAEMDKKYKLAISRPKKDPSLPNEVTFHENEDGKVETMNSGGGVKVSLSENFGSGMKWMIVKSDDMFELHDESKKGQDHDDQLRLFRFLAKPGTGSITFELRNPWKKELQVAKSVTFHVTAK